MARSPKVKEDTQEEKRLVWNVINETLLTSAHGIIQTNVREAVSTLLDKLGRHSLAQLILDDEALARVV